MVDSVLDLDVCFFQTLAVIMQASNISAKSQEWWLFAIKYTHTHTYIFICLKLSRILSSHFIGRKMCGSSIAMMMITMATEMRILLCGCVLLLYQLFANSTDESIMMESSKMGFLRDNTVLMWSMVSFALWKKSNETEFICFVALTISNLLFMHIFHQRAYIFFVSHDNNPNCIYPNYYLNNRYCIIIMIYETRHT